MEPDNPNRPSLEGYLKPRREGSGITFSQVMAQNEIKAAEVTAPANTSHVDKHPFINAIGRHRAGRSQAALDAINLKTATNADFVERLNEDCHVGPHLEWLPATAAMVTKAGAKAYVAGKIGEHGGYVGKATGVAAGATWGVVGGLYVGYETAELLENSCKSKAFEQRLLHFGQTPNSTPPGADTIPLPNLPNDVEKQIPGVRDVVDGTKTWVKTAYYLNFKGEEPPEHNSHVYDRAMQRSSMSNPDYIEWAKKESSYTTLGTATHHAAFAIPAYAGATYTANKLGLVNGSLPVKLAGVAVGLGLSWLGMRAHEETTLSELYSARLLSKPNDRP